MAWLRSIQDIQQATQIAYSMVTQMGMSDELGNIDLDTSYSKLSSETKSHIEHEVRRLVEEGKERATKLLLSKRKELDAVAKALVEHETLTKEDMEMVIKGEKLPDRLTSDSSAPMKLPGSLMPTAFGAGSAGGHTGLGVKGADDKS